MPGSYTFKPIEAQLTRGSELLGKMSTYCTFQLGEKSVKGAVCEKGGKNPHWEDLVTLPAPLTTTDSVINVQIMDKGKFLGDDLLGTASINISELKSTDRSSKWYPIFFESKPAGEILMEAGFDASSGSGLQFSDVGTTDFKSSEFREDLAVAQTGISGFELETKIFQEQRQVVEDRTFTKEVDVVETRAHMQEIEVMEPVKVMKDVQYTEVVPVTKQIETIEPQVVKKQVEVIEPRLVTKTIQVVENVPVMKEVEVIESIPVMKEVETFEPQTFTKQVEVTEQRPVTKQVEVSEPVHFKKTVEYVEPVITTKTITKEIRQPVIVDEKITTSVGPASLIVGEEIKLAETSEAFRSEEFLGSAKIFDSKLIESKKVKESDSLFESDLIKGDQF